MKKKTNVGLIVLIVCLILAVVGVSFAYYYAILRGKNENTISAGGQANLVYTEQDEPLSVSGIKSDTNGMLSSDYYEFSITTSDEDNNNLVNYVVYLEEMEGNTIAPTDISVYLTDKNDVPYYGYVNWYESIYSCSAEESYMTERGTSISDELISECKSYSEKHEDVDSSSNEYGGTKKVTSNLSIDGICNQYDDYYDDAGNLLGSNENQVDSSNCLYEIIQESINESRTLVGDNSFTSLYTNDHSLFGYSLDNAKNAIGDNHIIYVRAMAWDGLNHTNNFRLRYWIGRSNGLNAGDGTNQSDDVVIDGNSQSVTLGGNDSVFKFKVNVYGELIIK